MHLDGWFPQLSSNCILARRGNIVGFSRVGVATPVRAAVRGTASRILHCCNASCRNVFAAFSHILHPQSDCVDLRHVAQEAMRMDCAAVVAAGAIGAAGQRLDAAKLML